MNPAPRLAVLSLALVSLAAVARANDLGDLNLDPECRLTRVMVKRAVTRGDAAGLDKLGLTCLCRYHGAHAACQQKFAPPPPPKDAATLCKESAQSYRGEEPEIRKLLVNDTNSYLVPPGGWTGGRHAEWIQSKRDIGMFSRKDMTAQLEQLQTYEALALEYIQSCQRIIDEANGSTFMKWKILSPLGGSGFEDSWPGKKRELEALLPRLKKAVATVDGVLQ